MYRVCCVHSIMCIEYSVQVYVVRFSILSMRRVINVTMSDVEAHQGHVAHNNKTGLVNLNSTLFNIDR